MTITPALLRLWWWIYSLEHPLPVHRVAVKPGPPGRAQVCHHLMGRSCSFWGASVVPQPQHFSTAGFTGVKLLFVGFCVALLVLWGLYEWAVAKEDAHR